MTQPRGSASNSSAASAALSGAVDLSGLKARADAARQPNQAGGAQGRNAGSASGGAVLEVTESTFQAEVVERSLKQLVVVDLRAGWSEQSQQLSPVLEKLARESNGTWALAKVDVDANPRISQVFGAQSLPTVVAIAAGQPVDAFSGVLPESQIKQWIDQLLDAVGDRLPGVQATGEQQEAGAPAEEQDPRFTEAETALEQGDFAAAQAAYQRILDHEPGNEQAKAALTQVRFAERASKTDASAVTRADADPGDVEAQLTAADYEVAQGAAEDGFARLIATVRKVTGADRQRVREYLVGLFDLFDPADERVARARRDLASALF